MKKLTTILCAMLVLVLTACSSPVRQSGEQREVALFCGSGPTFIEADVRRYQHYAPAHYEFTNIEDEFGILEGATLEVSTANCVVAIWSKEEE